MNNCRKQLFQKKLWKDPHEPYKLTDTQFNTITFTQYKHKKKPKDPDNLTYMSRPEKRVQLQMALLHELYGQIGTPVGRKAINYEEKEAEE